MSFVKLTCEEKITIQVNNQKYKVSSGQSVAAALLELGISRFGNALREDREISSFCMMGVCYSCKVSIVGEPDKRACMIPIRAGMTVLTGANPESV